VVAVTVVVPVQALRKKGLAAADKKAGRVAAEGLLAQYIHAGSRSPPKPLSLPPPTHPPPPKTKNFIFLPFNNVKLPLQALSRPFHVCNPLSQNLHDGSVSAMILLTYVVAAAHATSRDMLLELLSEMGC